MNDNASSWNEKEIKKHIYYNQVRVNIAVAVVLLRKTLASRGDRDSFVDQIQSSFIKHWSEVQPRDGFEKTIISNLQEKCIKDFVKILPGCGSDIKDAKGSKLMNLVRNSVNISDIVPEEESDTEDEVIQNCDFLRLVSGLKNLVDTRKPINFDRSGFKTTSDFDDSGVDCGKSFNISSCYSASIASVPSIKFRSVTHSSETNVTLKVTLQKLLGFVGKVILNSAEDTVYKWKGSPADMSISTVKTLIKENIHVDIIADFVSKIFIMMWTSTEQTEINVLQYQIFILSKLLCHLNICNKLVEDLLQCVPTWCSDVERLNIASSYEDNHNFMSKGPFMLDLISLVLKKWFCNLKTQNFTSDKTNILTKINIKDLWKAKWECDKNTTEEKTQYQRYRDFVKTLRKRLLKFLRRINDDFPLLSPQIFCIIEILDKCDFVLARAIQKKYLEVS